MNQGKNKNQITMLQKKNNSVLNVYIYTLKKQKGHTINSISGIYGLHVKGFLLVLCFGHVGLKALFLTWFVFGSYPPLTFFSHFSTDIFLLKLKSLSIEIF